MKMKNDNYSVVEIPAFALTVSFTVFLGNMLFMGMWSIFSSIFGFSIIVSTIFALICLLGFVIVDCILLGKWWNRISRNEGWEE